jgi:hypothetical protein
MTRRIRQETIRLVVIIALGPGLLEKTTPESGRRDDACCRTGIARDLAMFFVGY